MASSPNREELANVEAREIRCPREIRCQGKSGVREIRCQYIILREIRCQYIILREIRCQFIILARKDELTPDYARGKTN